MSITYKFTGTDKKNYEFPLSLPHAALEAEKVSALQIERFNQLWKRLEMICNEAASEEEHASNIMETQLLITDFLLEDFNKVYNLFGKYKDPIHGFSPEARLKFLGFLDLPAMELIKSFFETINKYKDNKLNVLTKGRKTTRRSGKGQTGESVPESPKDIQESSSDRHEISPEVDQVYINTGEQ